jgi:DNA-binding transcriptional regulator WhiA
MEKTIDLKRDPVFWHHARLNENRNYPTSAEAVSEAVMRRAEAVSERIGILARRGKLDAIDLQIITMRQRSPMPTLREIGNTVHLSKQAVHHRAEKILCAIESGISR